MASVAWEAGKADRDARRAKELRDLWLWWSKRSGSRQDWSKAEQAMYERMLRLEAKDKGIWEGSAGQKARRNERFGTDSPTPEQRASARANAKNQGTAGMVGPPPGGNSPRGRSQGEIFLDNVNNNFGRANVNDIDYINNPEPRTQGEMFLDRWGPGSYNKSDGPPGNSTGGNSTGGNSTGGKKPPAKTGHETMRDRYYRIKGVDPPPMGTRSGGNSNRGKSTGGKSTGGNSTGGNSNRGNSTGGEPTGGHAEGSRTAREGNMTMRERYYRRKGKVPTKVKARHRLSIAK